MVGRDGGGGQFKAVDNLVVDRHDDGASSVRFVPTSHQDTPFSMSELVDRYRAEQSSGRHHRALLVGLFALDFLTIHPFTDGNWRLSRLLSTRLLSENGYGVGRYVSLEGLIYERRDAYCDALAALPSAGKTVATIRGRGSGSSSRWSPTRTRPSRLVPLIIARASPSRTGSGTTC
ncbi:MAG TPA: Fic family protein [Acidimicrobiales bacterium]